MTYSGLKGLPPLARALSLSLCPSSSGGKGNSTCYPSGLCPSPARRIHGLQSFPRFSEGVRNRNKCCSCALLRWAGRLVDYLSTHPVLPADVCRASLTRYWLLPMVVFKYCLLIFFPSWFSLASSPSLLPGGQVVAHVSLQVLHVHIAPRKTKTSGLKNVRSFTAARQSIAARWHTSHLERKTCTLLGYH